MLEKFHSRHSWLLLLFLREKAGEEGRGKRIGEREREKGENGSSWATVENYLHPFIRLPSDLACPQPHQLVPRFIVLLLLLFRLLLRQSLLLLLLFFPLCSSYWFLWRLSPACLQTLRFRWLLAGTRRSSGGLRISGRNVWPFHTSSLTFLSVFCSMSFYEFRDTRRVLWNIRRKDEIRTNFWMERGTGLGIAWKSNENDLADFTNELCSCGTFFRYYLKRCILFIYLYYTWKYVL